MILRLQPRSRICINRLATRTSRKDANHAGKSANELVVVVAAIGLVAVAAAGLAAVAEEVILPTEAQEKPLLLFAAIAVKSHRSHSSQEAISRSIATNASQKERQCK